MGALSKCPSCTHWHGASVTTVGSLSQCLTILTVQKSSLVPGLILLRCSSVPFLHCHWLCSRAQYLPPLPLLGELQRSVRSPLSLHFCRLSSTSLQPLLTECSFVPVTSFQKTSVEVTNANYLKTFVFIYNSGIISEVFCCLFMTS